MENYILKVEKLYKTYREDVSNFNLRSLSNFGKIKKFNAINNVTFGVKKGEIVGLIGESGCGKTTIGRIITGLLEVDNGSIFYKGQEIYKHKKMKTKNKIQMIFQDPSTSLNPQLKIKKIFSEALYSINVKDKKLQNEIINNFIVKVGLTKDYLNRYPHELSGGQKQRVCILLALLTNPEFIVADEVVSALDLSVQAQILNLLKDLQKELNLSMLFISHDLNIVHYLVDRIFVMYKGEIVESGDCDEVYHNPKHPYTKLLLSSILEFDKEGFDIDISVVEEKERIYDSCCVFVDRCKYRKDICFNKKPKDVNVESKTKNDIHKYRCHFDL